MQKRAKVDISISSEGLTIAISSQISVLGLPSYVSFAATYLNCRPSTLCLYLFRGPPTGCLLELSISEAWALSAFLPQWNLRGVSISFSHVTLFQAPICGSYLALSSIFLRAFRTERWVKWITRFDRNSKGSGKFDLKAIWNHLFELGLHSVHSWKST